MALALPLARNKEPDLHLKVYVRSVRLLSCCTVSAGVPRRAEKHRGGGGGEGAAAPHLREYVWCPASPLPCLSVHIAFVWRKYA